MAYSKICIYCHVVTLEGYNTEQRKFYEQGTTQLHTRERCAEARSKAGLPAHSYNATPRSPQSQSQSQPSAVINQEQKTKDIKDAQEERRVQHRELITTMQNLTKAIIADIASRRGDEANDIIESMNYEQSREDKFDFQDEVV
jgi:hypothetical protein